MTKLFAALVAARQEVRATVFKAGRNESQRFAYVGHEHVLVSGAREALLKHGLALVQTCVEHAGEATYRTSKGEAIAWRWRGAFVLAHVSGETLSLVFEATTQAGDKASYVASTALDRTAHLRVLELAGSSEEDPEDDSHDAQPPQSNAGVDQLIRDLASVGDADTLTDWARALVSARGEKAAAWHAFGAACSRLGLAPAVIAERARKGA